jgi:SAM-dependent methyltransferase
MGWADILSTSAYNSMQECSPMQHEPDRVANFFVHRSAAQRYAAARPYFHPQVIRRIVATTQCHRFNRAVDIACGTGQSSRALADVANRVDAIDISWEMLSEATPHPRIARHVAAAENLPFADNSFELATVGLAFHWFDQAAFLNEAKRVLEPGGWLVIYTSGFDGEMRENAEFQHWALEVYRERFPPPPRRSWGVSAESAKSVGFSLIAQEHFAHQKIMTAQQLTGYLLTQTNVIAAVESGNTPLADAAAWIMEGVRPFFTNPAGTLTFTGTIWFLRRTCRGTDAATT